jgi:hypothetical protein
MNGPKLEESGATLALLGARGASVGFWVRVSQVRILPGPLPCLTSLQFTAYAIRLLQTVVYKGDANDDG